MLYWILQKKKTTAARTNRPLNVIASILALNNV